jgi:hypothetical protein
VRSFPVVHDEDDVAAAADQVKAAAKKAARAANKAMKASPKKATEPVRGRRACNYTGVSGWF